MEDNSDVRIRFATKEDMVAVGELAQELVDYHKQPGDLKVDVKALEKDGFDSSPPAFRCLVAERAGRSTLAGFALYFPAYSLLGRRGAVLQGLYVSPAERGAGLGDRLLRALAKELVSAGYSRLEFSVTEWNRARSFYQQRGAEDLTDTKQWRCYRLSGDALTDLAAADHGTVTSHRPE